MHDDSRSWLSVKSVLTMTYAFSCSYGFRTGPMITRLR